MANDIFIVLFSVFVIFLWRLAWNLEKTKINEYANEEDREKLQKRARNIFYIFTDIILVSTIVTLLEFICYEYYFLIFMMFPLYLGVNSIVFVVKTRKNKGKWFKYFMTRLSLGLLMFLPILAIYYYDNLYYDIGEPTMAKPVVYIYPEQETKVEIRVAYSEKLSCAYPEYDNGWKVIAQPNGDLVDVNTGRNLYCLYWEGVGKEEYKFEDGFVVAGEDSAKFLEEKLAILGLNEREANEFIIYWLPKLEANKYNLIRFETMEEIENYMPLNIAPKPDTLIRLVMDFKCLSKPIEIEKQILIPVQRNGYTVVEWGGTEF